jgi:hypothetical protein
MSNDASTNPTANGFVRRLMPKEWWIIETLRNGGYVAAGLWEYPENHVFWEKIPLSGLPNDLISLDDLVRFGIALNPDHEISVRIGP